VILPDVNVLVYAFRSDAEDHEAYKTWLEDVINGSAAYGMSPQVLASVIRLTTHPRIFARPDRLEDAVAFASALLNQSNCQVIEPGRRHWGIFTDLCRSANAYGNLVQDAWLAALAIEWGCEWITNDRDFARFEKLQWRTAFADTASASKKSAFPPASFPLVRKTPGRPDDRERR
jgi:toxin-antitoxin system PIN domain toxin